MTITRAKSLLNAIALVALLATTLTVSSGGFPARAASDPTATPTPSVSPNRTATPTSSPMPARTQLGSPADNADATDAPPALQPVVSSAGFTHPGVFNSLDSLDASRKRVLAGEEPWLTIFQQLLSSDYVDRGAPDFTRFATAKATDPLTQRCGLNERAGCVTYCGSFNVPDVGCTDARLDARAVYAQALAYWFTDDDRYAQRAIAILNSYAKHFKGNTGSNGPLVTAWLSETMLRGAEILRYTYVPAEGDEAFDVDGFSEMLRIATVPTLSTFDYGPYNGNWKLSAADGLINAAVFLDDRKLYDRALTMWREAVPAYIYASTDGDLPHAPPNAAGRFQSRATVSCLWLANKATECQTQPKTDPAASFQNGQSQESCRDFGHTALGLGATINAAETAHLQGDDLYGEQRSRIMGGVLYAVQISQTFEDSGWPRGFCGGTTELTENLSLANLAADVVYNAYAVRLSSPFSTMEIPGYSATYPEQDPLASFIAAKRTTQNPVSDVSAWESLTHHLADKPVEAAEDTDRLVTPSPMTAPTSTETPSGSGSPTARSGGDSQTILTFALPATALAAVVAATSAALWPVVRRLRRRA